MAIERLEGTLKWRREYGVHDLTADMVEPEVSEFLSWAFTIFFLFALVFWACHLHIFCVGCMEKAITGKQVVFGYDMHRRPALYMIPSRQNTEESPRQIQHTVWMLERALDLTGPGVECATSISSTLLTFHINVVHHY